MKHRQHIFGYMEGSIGTADFQKEDEILRGRSGRLSEFGNGGEGGEEGNS